MHFDRLEANCLVANPRHAAPVSSDLVPLATAALIDRAVRLLFRRLWLILKSMRYGGVGRKLR